MNITIYQIGDISTKIGTTNKWLANKQEPFSVIVLFVEVVYCFGEIGLLFWDSSVFITGESKWVIILISLGTKFLAWEESCIFKSKETTLKLFHSNLMWKCQLEFMIYLS